MEQASSRSTAARSVASELLGKLNVDAPIAAQDLALAHVLHVESLATFCEAAIIDCDPSLAMRLAVDCEGEVIRLRALAKVLDSQDGWLTYLKEQQVAVESERLRLEKLARENAKKLVAAERTRALGLLSELERVRRDQERSERLLREQADWAGRERTGNAQQFQDEREIHTRRQRPWI